MFAYELHSVTILEISRIFSVYGTHNLILRLIPIILRISNAHNAHYKHKWTLHGELKVNRHIKKEMGQGHVLYTMRLSVLFHL